MNTMKKYRILFGLFIILTIIFFVTIENQFEVDDMTVAVDDVTSFNEGWVLYREDGSSSPIERLPYREPSEAGTVIAMENTIPKEYAGKTLSFLSADKELLVILDGETIYTFGKDNKRLFGHTPGSVTNFVEIPDDFNEGHIRIEMVSPYANYASNICQITVGRKNILVLKLLKDNLINYGITAIIFLAGIILLVLQMIEVFSHQGNTGVGYLGFMCMLGSIYHAIETKSLSVFWGNQTIYSYAVFIILMLLPTFLQIYYLESVKRKYQKRFQIMLSICFLNMGVQMALQCLDIADFMTMAPLTHIVICLSIGTVIYTLVQILVEQKREMKFINYQKVLELVGAASILVGTLIDLAIFYVVKVGNMGTHGRVGMFIFSIFTMWVHVRKISDGYVEQVEENSRLMEAHIAEVNERNEVLLRANQEAEHARADAIEANQAKSKFLANMSHEIRTPINAVLGMDEMILRESTEENVKKYARDIQSAGETLLGLVTDILDISKIESGMLEIVEQEYSLEKMIYDVNTMLQGKAKAKDLEFKVTVNPELPSVLFGDETRVREIILNLLTNAIKYTDEGSVHLKVDFLPSERDYIILQVAVEDTGRGIREGDQQKLFQSFQRLDEIRNKNIEGTGLGLAITKRLVDLMDGAIIVKSEYGKGSVFKAMIPQKVIKVTPVNIQEGQVQTKAVEKKSGVYAPEATVLVVDDVEMNLRVFQGLLKKTGIKVDALHSGAECLDLVQEKHYDLIFLDHMMPEMDGIETLHNMKKLEHNLCADTPVLVLTANAIAGAKEEYLAEGFIDYISKPIKTDQLEAMLLKYLPTELLKQQEE